MAGAGRRCSGLCEERPLPFLLSLQLRILGLRLLLLQGRLQRRHLLTGPFCLLAHLLNVGVLNVGVLNVGYTYGEAARGDALTSISNQPAISRQSVSNQSAISRQSVGNQSILMEKSGSNRGLRRVGSGCAAHREGYWEAARYRIVGTLQSSRRGTS